MPIWEWKIKVVGVKKFHDWFIKLVSKFPPARRTGLIEPEPMALATGFDFASICQIASEASWLWKTIVTKPTSATLTFRGHATARATLETLRTYPLIHDRLGRSQSRSA
jgi:hypothetical protein